MLRERYDANRNFNDAKARRSFLLRKLISTSQPTERKAALMSSAGIGTGKRHIPDDPSAGTSVGAST